MSKKVKILDDQNVLYETLKQAQLKMLLEDRDLPTKGNKDEMVKLLQDHDSGKYVRETIVERDGDLFKIGVAINNQKQLLEISKLIDKQEASRMNMYHSDRIWFLSKQKPI